MTMERQPTPLDETATINGTPPKRANQPACDCADCQDYKSLCDAVHTLASEVRSLDQMNRMVTDAQEETRERLDAIEKRAATTESRPRGGVGWGT